MMRKRDLVKILEGVPDHAVIGVRYDTFDSDVISFAPFSGSYMHKTIDGERTILVMVPGESVSLPLTPSH